MKKLIRLTEGDLHQIVEDADGLYLFKRID